jgi:hypothetical protein
MKSERIYVPINFAHKISISKANAGRNIMDNHMGNFRIVRVSDIDDLCGS